MTESNETIKLADEARDLFKRREFKECIECLDRLNSKSTQTNKLIAKYSIDRDAKTCLDNLNRHSLDNVNELNSNQQSIIDYNRALILSKHLAKFKESINILERRINQIETNNDINKIIDQPIQIKIYILLITIYMERKCRIKRALDLLDRLNDKLNGENLPKNFYYLKVRCYLANTDFINFRKYMDKLTNNEQFMVSCYLESFGGIEQSISKLSTFNSLNNVHLKNNEALTKFTNDKVLALYDLSKIFTTLTPEVLYNLGLMHLNTGNVENAFVIFKSLIKDFRTNPRLWSRIADCHLLKFKFNQHNSLKCGLESVTRFVGENQQRKLILKPTSIKVNDANDEENLKSARNCLLNSLILVKQDSPSFYPSNEPMLNELKKFRSSLLAKLAYVNLCLNDFVDANFYSELSLKDEDQIPKGLLFIETIFYKFESLIWLNRIDEADQLIKRLETNLVRELINDEYDDYINHCKRLGYIDWDKKFLKYNLFYNIASFAALKQNLTELQKYLIEANNEVKNIQENLTYLILLSIYKYVMTIN